MAVNDLCPESEVQHKRREFILDIPGKVVDQFDLEGGQDLAWDDRDTSREFIPLRDPDNASLWAPVRPVRLNKREYSINVPKKIVDNRDVQDEDSFVWTEVDGDLRLYVV